MANEPGHTELTVSELDALEKLMDKHKLSEVVYGLQAVCLLKAEHLSHTWQDYHAAGVWTEIANKLEKLGVQCAKLPSIG
jgi:hypothetical protein